MRLLLPFLATIVFYTAVPLSAQVPSDDARPDHIRPEWIPVGAVPAPLEDRAVQAQLMLQSGIDAQQADALRSMRVIIEEYGDDAARVAIVPLVVDLLEDDTRILETPGDLQVLPETRLEALDILLAVGGAAADARVRASIRDERDGSIRAITAVRLAARGSDDPAADLSAVGFALHQSVSTSRGNEEEVVRFLQSIEVLIGRVGSIQDQLLIDALLRVADGPYSARARRSALTILESIAAR